MTKQAETIERAPRRRLAFWRRMTLRDVLFLTLPPMIFAVCFFTSVGLDYHRMHQYGDWWTVRTHSTLHFALRRIRSASHSLRAGGLRTQISAEEPGRESIRLRVDRAAWDAITSDVPSHWGEWIDATLEAGDDFIPVGVRLRGDSTAHWTTPKKSIAIRIKKGQLYHGQRRLNLTVKSVLSQHVSAILAEEADLLVPLSDVVPTFVNGTFHGLHRLVGRPDESFLRQSDRMPGNVFRGEALMRGDAFKGLPPDLFRSPYLWDRTAENSRPGAIGDDALFEWIADLNGSTLEDHERLMAWFDRDELSRLLAVMLICGDPYHMSDWHNQFWYEDPSSGKMHPIVWDLIVRRLNLPLYDHEINRLWCAVLRDPRIFAGALDLAHDWILDQQIVERAGELARSTTSAHDVAFEYEWLRLGIIPSVDRVSSTENTFDWNARHLTEWWNDSRVGTHFSPSAEGTTNVLDFVVGGLAYSRLEKLELGVESTASIELWADSNLNGLFDAGDRAVPFSVDRAGARLYCALDEPEELLPGCAAEGRDFVSEPLHYRYFVIAKDRAGALLPIESVTPSLRGRYSGEPPTATALTFGESIDSTRSWHPWQYAKTPPAPVRWSGDVHLSEDLVIERGGTLVIDPGTRVSLSPDVSVVVRGRVEANGEPDRPIWIQRAHETLPWGVFALQGEGANGSRLAHVRFEGGGGDLVERVEYKGSICVYNAQDVVFESCEFRANQRCDDLVNVVRGGVDLLRCVFEDANADSIDYDISTGEIRDCRISNSGNDGIDLMNCAPRIIGTRISDSGDKGISIGEDASPLIFECEITRCVRGLEVKDHSAPVILDSVITANELGMLQRHKSNYYAASGRAILVSSTLAGNETDYSGIDGARITLHDTEIGRAASDELGSPAEDSSWMHALMGVGPDSAIVLRTGEFADDFHDSTDGWRPLGSVRRLGVYERDLIAKFRVGAGAIGTRVDWSLPNNGSRYLLVIEATGTGLKEARAALARDGQHVDAELKLGNDFGVARVSVIELAPGRYEALTLSAKTLGTQGELRLHRWRLIELEPVSLDRDSR